MLKKFMENCKKPDGFYGKIVVMMMNRGHYKVANWGLKYLKINEEDKILDVGCGGGGNLYRNLKKYKNIHADGIDYSKASVEVSLKKLEKYKNRSNIYLGDVKKLPFENESYDSIYASETIYFWNPIVDCFKEVLRVLKKGGHFLVICEMANKEKGAKWSKYCEGMTIYNPDEIEDLLIKAGFKNLEVHTKGEFVAINAEK